MKKWTPWLLAIVLLALLVTRLFYRHIGGVEEERRWYISQLHYDFSARVDSVIGPGRVLINVTHGDVDLKREWKLKEELRFNGMLHLVISRGNDLDVLAPVECRPDDSLYINSDKNLLCLYRDQELLLTRPLSTSLRGRPF